nr:hypothetical protein [Tanacetum cinerariifolium]
VSKNWLVQKQTALGKDTSNSLTADNLPKILWYSTHRITFMKIWLVQKQTALGKDSSNPLTVDSLLKTIGFSIHYYLTNEVLAIPGQTVTDDAKGIHCLPNEEIFTGLARIGSKFYMYHRFIQLIIQNQLDDLSTHTTKYIFPALTQKVFANMRRIGKGFSGVETPLFEAALEDVLAAVLEDVHNESIPSPNLPTPPPPPS